MTFDRNHRKLDIRLDINLDEKIKKAAETIGAGGLVVYPTETVYGLGADALNRDAVLKVFAAKSRALDNPLSVAVKDLKQADTIAYVNDAARKLAEAFLPGPLTIVLKKRSILPKELTSGLDNVGIRIPDNPVALRLIELAGPITATSANISGQPSPTTAEEAKRQIGEHVDLILDGGECKIGEESTVVDVSEEGEEFKILREGTIVSQAIEAVLKLKPN